MYCIIDLRQDPQERVPNVQFETIEECCNWIEENGGITIYTIAKI